jgi:hypothetical protein
VDNGPLQIFPPGLLGFLQLKNAGRNPQVLIDSLAPVLNAFEWYMQATQLQAPYPMSVARTNGQTGSAAFTTPAGGLVIPAHEWWWVDTYTLFAGGLIATDTVQLVPTLFDPIAGTVRQVGAASDQKTGSAATRAVHAFGRQFFAPPGSVFSVGTPTLETATSVTVFGYVRYTVLPI